MVNPEILDYVKKELARGVSEAKLRQALMEHGWPEFEINEAFEESKKSIAEKPPEETLKEITVEKPEAKKPEEKSFREFLEKLEETSGEKEKPTEKPSVSKPPVVEDIKKIVTNKVFVILAAIMILSSVAYFIIPSLFDGEEKIEGISGDAMDYVKETCRQFCDSGLCGLFIDPSELDHPEFPELVDKSCVDLGVPCRQPNGQPKCETEY